MQQVQSHKKTKPWRLLQKCFSKCVQCNRQKNKEKADLHSRVHIKQPNDVVYAFNRRRRTSNCLPFCALCCAHFSILFTLFVDWHLSGWKKSSARLLLRDLFCAKFVSCVCASIRTSSYWKMCMLHPMTESSKTCGSCNVQTTQVHYFQHNISLLTTMTIRFIMEYGGYDLGKIIKHCNRLAGWSALHVRFISWQILAGLNYLHSANIVHRVRPRGWSSGRNSIYARTWVAWLSTSCCMHRIWSQVIFWSQKKITSPWLILGLRGNSAHQMLTSRMKIRKTPRSHRWPCNASSRSTWLVVPPHSMGGFVWIRCSCLEMWYSSVCLALQMCWCSTQGHPLVPPPGADSPAGTIHCCCWCTSCTLDYTRCVFAFLPDGRPISLICLWFSAYAGLVLRLYFRRAD